MKADNADLMAKSFSGVPLEPDAGTNNTLLSIAEATELLHYVCPAQA